MTNLGTGSSPPPKTLLFLVRPAYDQHTSPNLGPEKALALSNKSRLIWLMLFSLFTLFGFYRSDILL